jgi:hypothetical protein
VAGGAGNAAISGATGIEEEAAGFFERGIEIEVRGEGGFSEDGEIVGVDGGEGVGEAIENKEAGKCWMRSESAWSLDGVVICAEIDEVSDFVRA